MYWDEDPTLITREMSGVPVWNLAGDWNSCSGPAARQKALDDLEIEMAKVDDLLVLELLRAQPIDAWGENTVILLVEDLVRKGVQVRLVLDPVKHKRVVDLTQEFKVETYPSVEAALPQQHQGLVLTWQTVEGPWLAYSLDFDLMSEADTEAKALRSLRWVLRTAAKDDVERGTDLWARAPAGMDKMLKVLRDHEDDPTMSLQRANFTF